MSTLPSEINAIDVASSVKSKMIIRIPWPLITMGSLGKFLAMGIASLPLSVRKIKTILNLREALKLKAKQVQTKKWEAAFCQHPQS